LESDGKTVHDLIEAQRVEIVRLRSRLTKAWGLIEWAIEEGGFSPEWIEQAKTWQAGVVT